MFKLFQGFHLVEAYQELKKAKRLSQERNASRFFKLGVAIATALVLWLMPTEAFGIEGLTVIEQRVIAIFVLSIFYY